MGSLDGSAHPPADLKNNNKKKEKKTTNWSWVIIWQEMSWWWDGEMNPNGIEKKFPQKEKNVYKNSNNWGARAVHNRRDDVTRPQVSQECPSYFFFLPEELLRGGGSHPSWEGGGGGRGGVDINTNNNLMRVRHTKIIYIYKKMTYLYKISLLDLVLHSFFLLLRGWENQGGGEEGRE